MNGHPPIITLPIKIAQINIQRKKHATIQLLNNNTTEFDIILIQEPAWSFIGRDPDTGKEINGPVALHGWSTILPVTSMTDTSLRPRTLTYYRPRPDFNITLRSDLIEDRDIQVLDIYQLNQPTATIINVYNDTPTSGKRGLDLVKPGETQVALGISRDIKDTKDTKYPRFSPKLTCKCLNYLEILGDT